MKIKKWMRHYYQKKCDRISMPDPESVFTRIIIPKRRFITISWSDAIGYLVILGIILHYIFKARLFETAPFIPVLTFVF